MAKDIVEEMYQTKEAGYFSLEREIFIKAITGNGLRVLDVGCGTGALGAWLKKNKQCTVYGIEINAQVCSIAKENLDEVLNANIELIDLPYPRDYFDAVVMGDVLEHLVNPIPAIQKLFTVIKPGGHIYITVPNIRHWKEVMALVFKDQFEYQSWGILDYTHLRFFTRKSITQLMLRNNIKVNSSEWVIQKPSKSRIINMFTFGLFEGFLASHTFLVLEK